MSSTIKPILRHVLTSLIKQLGEDELMHFNKIHCPIEDMSKSKLISAIQLVERTLNHANIDYFDVVQESLRKISIDK